ncbi:hypothetical protein B0H63DRAFT_450694 [Podospora didyma]|uniref:NAD(P)-binding domain-containing protein n=1 Tax=Podospora didyma TaxID=330526 RepID=A0AAE0NGX4_9PEZI|nr:hypothetical protein B0H63DRAFT_450694 [Podospora didyma]
MASTTTTGASAALFGSTGLVGSHILSTLLVDTASFPIVQTISRRAPKSTGPSLSAIIEGDTSAWTTRLAALSPAPRTVISSVGTTRADAGGIANQWKIDHDLNVSLAQAAKSIPSVQTFVFISSAGTRFTSWAPYSKMKTGVENAIKEQNFEHAIILRPGLIIGDREGKHNSDLFVGAVRWFGNGVKDSLGAEAEVIARAAVHAVKLAEQGKAPSKYWILENKDILRLGRDEWTA